MKRKSTDDKIGFILVFLFLLVIGWTVGISSIFYLIYLLIYGAIVLFLWNLESRLGRTIAIVLMPAILFVSRRKKSK